MTDLKELMNYVDEEGLVRFARDLIKIRSVYDPLRPEGNEEKAATFVADFLKEEGFEVHVEEVVSGRPNVIAFLRGKQPGKTLLFEGHTDVVTPGDLSTWNFDPFGAEIAEGRIYGRGACDTKGNLAAAIFAAKAVKDAGIGFDGTILLCIPCDEEDMMIGIKDFIAKGWADNVDGAVICEPEENQLCIFQKGAMRVIVRVYGKQSHGAMPLSGINPNWRLAKIICELELLERSEKERLGNHEYLGLPSITPTVIRSPSIGEPQLNVVPGEAYMALDLRTVPGQTHEELKSEIQRIFDRLATEDPDFKATMEVIEERPWTETSKEEPVVKAIAKAYETVTGREAVYNGVPGATDGTFLHAWKQIPVVVTGAGNRLIPHQSDEYVEIAELIETTKMYALTAMNFLGF
ncbi:MAG: peptidase M20 [Firmicutes bacterium HGW-Firmicutes-11]|jgi:succinyl-diaminopimelate desuccinylase|nr:MAG: peptidase M20 [Firmicutes bacterium HGW-Firmicutes-11]